MKEEYLSGQVDMTSKNLKEEWSIPSTVAAHQARYNWYLDWLMPYLEMEYRYLDMGCRNGEFLVQLRERTGAWKLWGVEIHEEAAVLAGDKGVAVQNIDIHELDMPDDFFDFVFLQHILEHSHDPVRVMWQAERVVKRQGKIFIEVPLEPVPDKIPTIWEHWYTFQNPQMLIDLVMASPWLKILKQEEDLRSKWFRLLLEKKE